MVSLVQQSFLRWLHLQRDHERLTNYQIYDGYYNGEHEVSIPVKVRAALESELGTVSNLCRVVVDSAVGYICAGQIGIEVMQAGSPENIGQTTLSVPPEVARAEALLYDVYEANQLLYGEMLKTVTIMGKKGDVFLKLYIEDGQIKVRALRPDICFPRYRSDDYKDMLCCAIKWFDEGEEEENPPSPPFTKGGASVGAFAERGASGSAFTKVGTSGAASINGGKGGFADAGRSRGFVEAGRSVGWKSGKGWKAQVFRPDVVEYYELGETAETEYSQWELVGIVENPLGFIPIVHIRNTVDDLEYGVSDLQVVTDLQDALNKTITDMLLTMDNQAFQRMFIFGGQTPGGHEISMEPGMITEVPNENGKLEVVQAADIGPFLEAMKEIVDQVCAVASIPRFGFPKSGGGQVSGYALRVHHIPLERKCAKKKIILKDGFGKLNRMIFAAARLLGMDDFTGLRTRMQFTGGLPVDELAQMQVHEMELGNKIKSRRTVMQERGIVDVDAEIAQIEAEESRE